MDWTEFPTLNSLRAFSAVAETVSFTRAAASLNVTHAAVSQQVKALEDRIGLTLIERKGKVRPFTCPKRGSPWRMISREGLQLFTKG